MGIEKLISVFNRTTASYKFYWLISIVELVEQGMVEIPKSAIYARMISNSWYTINYFHISFGKEVYYTKKGKTRIRIINDTDPDP